MAISVFDLYSIGIGPSSSHTMGPMRAARQFLIDLRESSKIGAVVTLVVELYGSLAMTGKGHATDRALLLGLGGYLPENTDPDIVESYIETIFETETIHLLGGHKIPFIPEKHIQFLKGKKLPYHTNAMRFICFDKNNEEIEKEVFYSLGGGFVVSHPEISYLKDKLFDHPIPFPFDTGEQLLQTCRKEGMSISQLMFENEKTWRGETQIKEGLLRLWDVMQSSVRRGIMSEGILPGGLGVKRRAPALYHKLIMSEISGVHDHGHFLDWTSLFALAVNEENASGGRIVTAPTNGAAGILPAILHYFQKFIPNYSEEGVIEFLLTAGAMGILYKKGASISGAEMGCQGEVGVASSMAAAGLTAVVGGINEQVLSAAEIAMEHHLGMTCDPVAGLVQIPCIERNTMGAIKAINASRLAMHGNGEQCVSIDAVIAAMREIGMEMHSKFKETSEGGLATSVSVCIPQC